jgi:ATP-dependent RNA helicase RhlE
LTFQDFNLDANLMDGLLAMNFKQPTPIQQQAIPTILEGRDLIACAQTGTGKTAAYLLPILHKITQSNSQNLNTLIIAPTRELALQIDQQIEALSYFVSVSSMAVYGGGDGVTWEQQRKALVQGSDIITATPGRLIQMLTSGKVDMSHLKHLILDEADRMLDMGFYDDILRIISFLPKERQTLLFSATMPPKIRLLASRILQNPSEINIAISKPAEGINQQAYLVYDGQKEKLLDNILKREEFQSIIIFAGTKEGVKKMGASLARRGLKIAAFHSDLEQNEREEIMRQFKNGKLRVLIGTDILSRGIDVEGIDLVVNFDVPADAEDYVHRIGRTARAATKGTAITFVNEKDQRRLSYIEKLIEKEVPKIPLPEGFDEGPAYQPNLKRPDERRSGGGGNRGGKGKPPFRGNRSK